MWYRFSQNNDFPEEIDLENIKVNPYSEDVFPMSENYSPSDVVQHIAIVFKMKIDELLPNFKKRGWREDDTMFDLRAGSFLIDTLRAALKDAQESVVFLKEMGYPVNFTSNGKTFEDSNLLILKAFEEAQYKSKIRSKPLEQIPIHLSTFWKFFRDSLKSWLFPDNKDVYNAFDKPTSD